MTTGCSSSAATDNSPSTSTRCGQSRPIFAKLDRDPTDAELETIAQTWSEHCSHKTLKGPIDFTETIDGKPRTRRIDNLLKETIFGATQELRQRLGRRRLVRERLRRQCRRRQVRRAASMLASRSRPTITRRRSSPMAARTRASAASSAIRSAPDSARSRFATPMCSALRRRTFRPISCRPACCTRGGR